MLYRAAWWLTNPLFRLGFRTRIEGRANIPRQGAAILASNHLSFLDHLLLPMATRRQIYFISKVQHFDKPVRGYLFRKWGVIPLRRGEADSTAFDRALATLRDGNLFAIYPEGTRSRDGALHRGHTGAVRMAYLTGAPIVPVAMWGTFEALPKGASFPRPKKCGVRVGKPIAFEKNDEAANDRDLCRQRTDEVMRSIQRLSRQSYVDDYQYNPEVPTHRRSAEHPESVVEGED